MTSANWQESDRFLAGLMTAFGSPTRAIEMDGAGEFDGVLLGAFRRPRIEGHFRVRAMQAFDVTWGDAEGDVVIENSYANVSRDRRRGAATRGWTSPGSSRSAFRGAMAAKRSTPGSASTGGRSSTCSTPSTSRTIRSSGLLSGEFHVYGPYTRPFGFGRMTIDDGTAYGERFSPATAGAALRGQRRAPGRDRDCQGQRRDHRARRTSAGTGPIRSMPTAAACRWSRWTFASAADLPPLTGVLDFSASGSATFAEPRYDVKVGVQDLFFGEEGVGRSHRPAVGAR